MVFYIILRQARLNTAITDLPNTIESGMWTGEGLSRC